MQLDISSMVQEPATTIVSGRRYFTLEMGDTKFHRKVSNYLPNHTKAYPRRQFPTKLNFLFYK
jgi:hypothetical protein